MPMTRVAAAAVAALVLSHRLAAAELELGLPVACELGQTCWVQQYPDVDPSPAARDYTCGSQTYDGHDGTDIRIRDITQSADVIAAAPGVVRAIRDGADDRLMRAEADRVATGKRECGNGAVIVHDGGWETQYCHLRKNSLAVAAGERVAVGQKLGAIGYSGLAAFPHVHLSVRKDGKAVDPFLGGKTDSGRCGGAARPLWTKQAQAALAYRRGDLIGTGFAPGAVDLPALEDGRATSVGPADEWTAVVAYVWAINLEAGDEVSVTLAGPGGLSTSNRVTLDRAKAHYMLFTGRKRPASGWPKGHYAARAEVRNGGTLRLSHDWNATLD
jgi:murein DD-endopeptidase MepM/ murein hydrolase activator NlpD